MITYQGRDYDFALKKTPTEELREVKRKCKLTVRQLMEGIEQLDVDAMTALRWLVLRSDRQHDDLVLNPDENYDYWEWLEAFTTAGEAAQPEDPTRAGSPPATPTPPSSESSDPISTTSPPSTASPSPVTAESPNGTSAVSPSPHSSSTSAASMP